MHILLVNYGKIPVVEYGGTERVIWYLGRELANMGHKVTYMVDQGYCDFGKVLFIDRHKSFSEQIPAYIDFVHFNFDPKEEIGKPYLVTLHGNINDDREMDINTVFVSKNHASRYSSSSYVHNGLDWNDYGPVNFNHKREYFHFLGKAAWRVKNVAGAIKVIRLAKNEKLKVLGGNRLNIKMGFRLTLSPKVSFSGMVDSKQKAALLQKSKGMIFPVKWHEPFGLALTESLYYGCPIFGTPYGSLPEIVLPEVGFLSNRSEELALALKNADSYSRKYCHEYAVEHFNSKLMAMRYLEKYEEVLNGKTLNTAKPKLKETRPAKFLEWH